MPDILHTIGIKSSSLNDAYKALTTREGLPPGGRTTRKGKAKSAECSNSALRPSVST
jgi:hypothetical protein